MTPDVSVIVAAYNVEKYLERAVASALAQEGVSVEVIVIDDVSTDATLNVARSFTDPRVSVIAQAQNGGPGVARNAGFAAAKGKWIAVLDGDDAMEPKRLQRCIAKAETAQADIIVDNLLVRREADGAEHPMFDASFFDRNPTLSLAAFIGGNVSFLGGTALGYMKPIFSRDFLTRNNLRYDTDIRIGEDYLLLADALACGGKCVCEPAPGYLYTARAGSISHRMTLGDVQRIETGDRKFLARHRLSEAEASAQQRREKGLRDAWGFTQLVDALKAKGAKNAVRLILSNPRIVWYLWRPLRSYLSKKFK